MALKVFSDGADTVVAENPEDACKVWSETYGADFDDGNGPMVEQPRDKKLTITFEDAPEGEEARTQTMAEWAAESSRGFLCSTEW